jgi:hypothetical protein
MDLALIPYRTDGPNRFLYPVKALEYLAGGRPVLSTQLPDVVRFLKDYVHLAATPDEWSRVAENWTQLKPQLADKARLGQTYALNRGWSAMIDEMCEDLPRP